MPGSRVMRSEPLPSLPRLGPLPSAGRDSAEITQPGLNGHHGPEIPEHTVMWKVGCFTPFPLVRLLGTVRGSPARPDSAPSPSRLLSASTRRNRRTSPSCRRCHPGPEPALLDLMAATS